MNNLKKVIVLLTMGLFTASCGNAQSDGKNQTKEYAAKTIIKKLNKGGLCWSPTRSSKMTLSSRR